MRLVHLTEVNAQTSTAFGAKHLVFLFCVELVVGTSLSAIVVPFDFCGFRVCTKQTASASVSDVGVNAAPAYGHDTRANQFILPGLLCSQVLQSSLHRTSDHQKVIVLKRLPTHEEVAEARASTAVTLEDFVVLALGLTRERRRKRHAELDVATVAPAFVGLARCVFFWGRHLDNGLML